ncbi:MAG: AAA family ATPase [Xanthobacteraceae bacterium]
MLLKNIKVVGLRSIEQTQMLGCGGLNVLIGKNNAGKSNLLSAITAFFNVVSSGDILNIRPLFKEEVDFFNKNTSKPIEVMCCFAIDSLQSAQIISSISADYPQVRNVVSALSESKFVKATVKYFYQPSPFGLVTSIALSSSTDAPQDPGDSLVYQVTDIVAPQLYERFVQTSKEKDDLRDFTKAADAITSDIYGSIRRDALSERTRPSPVRFYLDRYFPGRLREEIASTIEQDLVRSDNYSEFRAALSERISSGANHIKSIEKAPVAGDILTVGGQEHVVPTYVTEICRRFAEVRLLYQRERREPIGPLDAQQLLSLRVQKGGDRLFRAFQQTVNALIGVEVDAFEDVAVRDLLRRGPSEERRAQLDVDNFLIQVNGSGIKEALRLLLDVELAKPSIMLIEEPEVHLHPALETSMRRYLKKISDASQIFLTTHSTNFIDSGEYSSIYFVTKRDNRTNATLVTSEEAAEVLPEDLGLRPSSLFMFEKLIFVEGPSDEDVIREWAAILLKNLSQAGIGFISLGGSRNIKHFAAKKTTDFLNRRGVDLWFVLDRDEKESEQIAKLRQALGPRCNIRTLPVREIENYLVKTEPLARYISSRSIPNQKTILNISVDAVQSAIDECSGKLRDFTLAKTLLSRLNAPVYVYADLRACETLEKMTVAIKESMSQGADALAQRVDCVERTLRELTPDFDRSWKDNKLKIVPGTELLDAVFKKFGLAYMKTRDARGIAAAMTPDEVPAEIKAFLDDVIL